MERHRILRAVDHDAHLSVVEHLDELRSRIIASLAFIAVAFAVCFWQHGPLLHFLGKPLEKEQAGVIAKGETTPGEIGLAYKGARENTAAIKQIAQAVSSAPLTPAGRSHLDTALNLLRQADRTIPNKPPPNLPTTIGIGEPFTITITVCFYFALLASLPFLLFQLYSYVLPAFSPYERSALMPVLLTVPFLFAAGIVFGYEIVLPAAVHFLQGFNASSFNELVQATSYFSFAALIMLAMGVIFQVPLFVVALTRAGIVTPRQLRHNRRYAIAVAALVAAVLPGDVVTMLLETLPIIVLYEVGILVSVVLERRDRRRERARERGAATGAPPPPPPATDVL